MLASVRAYARDSKNGAFYAPLTDKLEELVKLNRLGIKTRQGFYSYSSQEDKTGLRPADSERDEEYKRRVAERLRDYFMNSVENILATGLYSREELAFAVKDYTGTDTDPFKAL
jgi:3-hydroxyacyl-CoA dehydrogenase